VLDVQRMMANAKGVFVERSRLSNALFSRIKVDPRLREIAILRTAKDCHSVYEWTQHVLEAKHVGVTDDHMKQRLTTKQLDDQTDVEIVTTDDNGAVVTVTDGPMKGQTGFGAKQNVD
jgi:4-carboxymuconolactone decarboxylase